MIIAIDGPAGSGKSTVAKIIAEKLGFTFLNSGSFYRGVTLVAIQKGVDISCEATLIQVASSICFDYSKDGHLFINGIDVESQLHSDRVDAFVAKISAIVELRHIINRNLHNITDNLNIVCEGRDMTTVVFPNADYKFFLDASADARAKRRFSQGCSNLTFEEIRNSIIERDKIDRNKQEGSLKIATDAVYFDTSDLTIDEVCGKIISKIQL